MLVILFRHGPAGGHDPRRWPDDRKRPLTDRGLIRTRDAARGLARMEGNVTRILSSPLVRSMDTAKIVQEVFELSSAIEPLEALGAGGSYRDVLRRVAEFGADDCVLLVGHEPDLGKLAGVMLFGAPASLPLKKAGACAIYFDEAPQAGQGILQWLIPPRGLRALGRKKSKV